MQERTAPAIAANRFGLGARPGELARIGRDARGWLIGQLAGGAPRLEDAGLQDSASILSQVMDLRRRRRAERAARAARGDEFPQPAAPSARGSDSRQNLATALRLPQALLQFQRRTYVVEATARFRHAVGTDRPFVERLVHFWANHFAVSVDKLAVTSLAGSLEREAIRPNVLGTFADLLLAVESHPAMLLYLDNHLSVGPNSSFARSVKRRRGRQVGINENLAREILELHTLGVDGGYTQADVTALARMITGWTIVFGPGPLPARGEPHGHFVFRPELHEPGAQTLLGKRYADDGYEQAVAALKDLATHPATARFIATKLARHFIADEPPPAAVDRLVNAFLDSGGNLPAVYRALVDSPEAWAQPLAKYKTPADYIISTFRGLELSVEEGRGALIPFELLGQRTWAPGSPAGWPDRSTDWDGPSALMKRIEWADAIGQRLGNSRNAARLAPALLGETLGESTRSALARAASGAQALTLLLVSPEFLRR